MNALANMMSDITKKGITQKDVRFICSRVGDASQDPFSVKL